MLFDLVSCGKVASSSQGVVITLVASVGCCDFCVWTPVWGSLCVLAIVTLEVWFFSWLCSDFQAPSGEQNTEMLDAQTNLNIPSIVLVCCNS